MFRHYDLNALQIRIDGSAFQKKHEYGYAGIIHYPDDFGFKDETIFKKNYHDSTINRMELKACIEALNYIRKNSGKFRKLGIDRVIIISDSDYVVSNQFRAAYWRKDKWLNQDGKEVENIDLWKKFLSIRFSVGINAEIVWEEGKSNQESRKIDQLAKRAAKSVIKDKDYGFRPGKIRRKKTSSSVKIYQADNQVEVIRIYEVKRKKTERKIFFEIFSKKEKKLTESYYAYYSAEGEIHTCRYYKVSFNDNLRYPVFKILRELKSIKTSQ